MDKKSLDFLEQLINAPSPSGFEFPASKIWKDYFSSEFFISTDTYGNSYVSIGSKNPLLKILLSAHIDEVGFMVNYISEEGFIYVSMIGGVDPIVATAKRVIIHNKNGPVKGIFGKVPIHFLEGDEEIPKLYDMFIDIGATDKEDALKLVSVGDPITFDMGFEEYPNDMIIGRGLDDKVGAWCIAETLIALSRKKELNSFVYGVATIQEENGIYGARMAIENVKPDIAIAIDVSPSTDYPGISNERFGDVKLGEGPTINIGSTSHPKINEMLISIAEKNRIPLQKEASPGRSGTDADEFFRARGGVPTANISIPCRNLHTPNEMVNTDDLENTVNLLIEFCIEYKGLK